MLWFDFLSLEVWRITVAVLAKLDCTATVRGLSPFGNSHTNYLGTRGTRMPYLCCRFVVICNHCKDQKAVQRLWSEQGAVYMEHKLQQQSCELTEKHNRCRSFLPFAEYSWCFMDQLVSFLTKNAFASLSQHKTLIIILQLTLLIYL